MAALKSVIRASEPLAGLIGLIVHLRSSIDPEQKKSIFCFNSFQEDITIVFCTTTIHIFSASDRQLDIHFHLKVD